MVYTDPTGLEFVLNENPLESSKLNQATNDQFLALFPDGNSIDTWSPTLEATGTNPGVSSAVGVEGRVAFLTFFYARFVLSSAGSGNLLVALPRASVGLTGSSSAASGSAMGGWHLRDDSTANTHGGSLQITGDDKVLFVVHESATARVLTDSSPIVLASGDVLTLWGGYPHA